MTHNSFHIKFVFATGLFILLTSWLLISCTKDPVTHGGGNGGGNGSPALTQRTISDTAYGTDPLQKMDIFLPAARNASTKVVVFIHGGAWESGNKNDGEYVQVINLIKQKWPEAAIANINYRLTSNPSIHCDEIMDDISNAVNFIVANKNNFFISDTLVMMGASAGAHLAMLYTYKYNTHNYVKSVADFFGPAQLSDRDWYNSYNIFLGKAIKDILIPLNGSPWNVPLYDANSPYSVVTAQSKPTIIFHGTADVIVPLYQSQWMRGRLNALGVPNEYHEYFDGHGFNPSNTADAVNKAIVFFKQHLQ